MRSSHDIERVYGPDTLKIMTTAFDSAHDCLPAKFKESGPCAAPASLRYVERGERNPVSLAELAVLDFLR